MSAVLDESFAVREDFVMTYMLESSAVAGRLVRLGPVADRLVSRHDLPLAVGLLLAEYLVAAAALATAMKFDGILTFQTRSDGPVSLMVADVTTAGELRATCQIDRERLARLGKMPSAKALLGAGYFAVTIDQGPDMDRYQGVVDIVGTRFSDTLDHYFSQSDQLDMSVRLAARYSDGRFGAAALTAQRVADEGGKPLDADEAAEDWRRAVILMSSVTDAELLDTDLLPADVLYRLFHEEGLRVFPPRPLEDACRCSAERVEDVLASLSPAELQDCLDDNQAITSVCEFCRTAYVFGLNAEGRAQLTATHPG